MCVILLVSAVVANHCVLYCLYRLWLPINVCYTDCICCNCKIKLEKTWTSIHRNHWICPNLRVRFYSSPVFYDQILCMCNLKITLFHLLQRKTNISTFNYIHCLVFCTCWIQKHTRAWLKSRTKINWGPLKDWNNFN